MILVLYTLCNLFQGPLWRQIRGCGYAYNYTISASPATNKISFQLAKATHVFQAYKIAKEIVVCLFIHSYIHFLYSLLLCFWELKRKGSSLLCYFFQKYIAKWGICILCVMFILSLVLLSFAYTKSIQLIIWHVLWNGNCTGTIFRTILRQGKHLSTSVNWRQQEAEQYTKPSVKKKPWNQLFSW